MPLIYIVRRFYEKPLRNFSRVNSPPSLFLSILFKVSTAIHFINSIDTNEFKNPADFSNPPRNPPLMWRVEGCIDVFLFFLIMFLSLYFSLSSSQGNAVIHDAAFGFVLVEFLAELFSEPGAGRLFFADVGVVPGDERRV